MKRLVRFKTSFPRKFNIYYQQNRSKLIPALCYFFYILYFRQHLSLDRALLRAVLNIIIISHNICNSGSLDLQGVCMIRRWRHRFTYSFLSTHKRHVPALCEARCERRLAHPGGATVCRRVAGSLGHQRPWLDVVKIVITADSIFPDRDNYTNHEWYISWNCRRLNLLMYIGKVKYLYTYAWVLVWWVWSFGF